MKFKLLSIVCLALLGAPLASFADAPQYKVPTGAETWIAFLPVILFILIICITCFKTKLTGLLAEKDPHILAAAVARKKALADDNKGEQKSNATPNDTTSDPAEQPSVSRFILFLTGLVALLLGVCISTFYMYAYFSNPAANLNLSNLTNVIWGLGIGVIPYGVNKASAALKP